MQGDANRVTSEAIQLHGGFGFTDEIRGIPLLSRRALRHARRRHLQTLRDLIGKRIMDATETGAELLAYDMINSA